MIIGEFRYDALRDRYNGSISRIPHTLLVGIDRIPDSSRDHLVTTDHDGQIVIIGRARTKVTWRGEEYLDLTIDDPLHQEPIVGKLFQCVPDDTDYYFEWQPYRSLVHRLLPWLT